MDLSVPNQDSGFGDLKNSHAFGPIVSSTYLQQKDTALELDKKMLQVKFKKED